VTFGSGLPLSTGGSVTRELPDGDGVSQVWSLVMKMQPLPSRSSAARSYRATTT
jgi:hypothetical protein